MLSFDTEPPRRRAQRRPREQPSEVERQLLEALRTRPVAPAPPPRSEDEFQIHKLIYESSTVLLNLEQLIVFT